MLGRGIVFVGAVTLMFVTASPSWACKGAKEIYSDNFKERDAGWFIPPADIQNGHVTVGDGRVLLKVDPGKGYTVLNFAFGLPSDSDICVISRLTDASDLSKATTGLVFWAKNYADNYVFQLTGDGKYWVSHWSNPSWEVVTPLANAPTFKSGLGVDNVLRVSSKQQSISLFVNDEQVAKFRAPSPNGLVKAGFRAGSNGTDPIGAEFRDFKVTDAP
jgi:hypothetical protein